MKKVLTLVSTLLLAAASLSAQQSLWAGQTAKSPEINPDNSVTFRLVAPKAVKVQVGGDFVAPVMSEVNGMKMEVAQPVDMVEKNGVWEYTTEPLASELYSYYFTVDGVTIKDPSNVTNYYLIGYINGANYGCEDDYQNLGSYKFSSGKLTATFSSDSYVFVKTGDNATFIRICSPLRVSKSAFA